ncbi:MAG: sel1 repeat family protein [Alphaproteobacteria bacterium]|nr:sel1 repeat family protein [Alphaproteobacteria bacterium]
MKTIGFYLCFVGFLVPIGPLAVASDAEDSAFNELRAEADRGAIAAQFALAEKYAQGNGAPQDYVRAHKWFNLAAALGHKDARQSRELFSDLMTPAQIADAQKLAREWFAQHRGGEK